MRRAERVNGRTGEQATEDGKQWTVDPPTLLRSFGG